MSEQFKIRITRKKLRRKTPTFYYHIEAINPLGVAEISEVNDLMPVATWFAQTFSEAEFPEFSATLSLSRNDLMDCNSAGELTVFDTRDYYSYQVHLDGPKAEDAVLQFLLRWECEKVGFAN